MIDRKDKIQKFVKDIGRIAIKADLSVGEILDGLCPAILATICHISSKEKAEWALIDTIRYFNDRFPQMYDSITDKDRK